PAFPSLEGQWPYGTGYPAHSGGTAPDSHRLPRSAVVGRTHDGTRGRAPRVPGARVSAERNHERTPLHRHRHRSLGPGVELLVGQGCALFTAPRTPGPGHGITRGRPCAPPARSPERPGGTDLRGPSRAWPPARRP